MVKQGPKFIDYLLVLGFCIALYAVVLAVGGPLTMLGHVFSVLPATAGVKNATY